MGQFLVSFGRLWVERRERGEEYGARVLGYLSASQI